jgi:hypothetical protein
MPIVVGDNAFCYAPVDARELESSRPTCYGRACSEKASHLHRVRSEVLKLSADTSALLLCETHGDALLASPGVFMGVIGVREDMGVHSCEYRGCSNGGLARSVEFAGLGRAATLFLCSAHSPVFGVRRLRPRRTNV